MEEVKCEQVATLQGGKWEKMHDIAKRVYGTNGIAPTLHTCGGGNLEPKIMEEPVIIEDFYKNRGNRYYEEEAPTIRADREGLKVAEPKQAGFRVRKLTEKECFRLQGVKDEDFAKIRKNQSKSSCYHLAGDSIVSTVLMALFGQMLNIDWKEKVNKLVGELVDV